MQKSISLNKLFFLSFLLIVNCISYDLHPYILMGTKIFLNENKPEKSIYLLSSIPNTKIEKKVNKRFSEYYLLPVYAGGLLGLVGSRSNGELGNFFEEEIRSIALQENEVIIIQNIKTKIDSIYMLDLLNTFIPYVRYFPLIVSAEISIMKREELRKYLEKEWK